VIDRKALVQRHNPRVHQFDPEASLSIGNGEFAMTVDATGLQSFPELYDQGGVPLGTMSNWGWHTSPNPKGYSLDDFPQTYVTTFSGRQVGYAYADWLKTPDPATSWLRDNPHRLHLGHIQLHFTDPQGSSAALPSDFGEFDQQLDLWSGVIDSQYRVFGQPVTVHTACHPSLGELSFEHGNRAGFRVLDPFF